MYVFLSMGLWVLNWTARYRRTFQIGTDEQTQMLMHMSKDAFFDGYLRSTDRLVCMYFWMNDSLGPWKIMENLRWKNSQPPNLLGFPRVGFSMVFPSTGMKDDETNAAKLSNHHLAQGSHAVRLSVRSLAPVLGS